MPKQIIIAEQHRIAAVFSEDQIQELIVATGSHQIGDVYLGVVENVLPGIDAAFVNIGDSERNGFIHVTDLGPLRLRRSAGSITELLAPQQKVLVQVMKEPTGNKGPRLTGNITLPGRYLVLMPYGKGVNLSRRIRNENERNRLRALAILIKPAGMGLLVRTEAEGMAEDAILEDLENLQKQWEAVLQEASSTRAPALLNRDDDFIQRVLRDMYTADVNRIVVDSHTGLKRVKQHLLSWSGGRSPQGVLIDQHRDRIPILEYFRVNAAIREALKPRVDLPSGGYIIIEPTEALTVIDVNSGSFTRSATARETVLWTNCEAATEIARQLRLRNIAGVIIVDFIDMDSRRDQLQVLEHFNKAIKADKSRPQIAQLSELGLVELTRKRQGQNIYELFGRACQTCGGLGHLVHLPGESHDSEFIERPAASGYREYSGSSTLEPRTRVREPFASEPPAPRESVAAEARGSDSEFYGSDEGLEPDLMNHPSYQERGGANRRRRRRRIGVSLGEGEPMPKGPVVGAREMPTKTVITKSDFAKPDFAKPDFAKPDFAKPDFAKPDFAKPDFASEPEPIADVPEDLEIPAKEIEPERVERAKPAKREFIKPVSEPPETITVEMTADEQDVYALMGISPLVLLTREIRDPKSAIVTVALPGQAPPPQPEAAIATDEAVAEPEVEDSTPMPTPAPKTVTLQPAIAAPSPEPVLIEEAVTNNGDGAATSSASEPESNLGARRRRRRSSALGTENQSDS